MTEQEKNLARSYLEAINLDGLKLSEKAEKVAKEISKIPWGSEKTVEGVLQNKNGNCTGKHKLLQACFDVLHVRYNTVVCTFKWGEQEIRYPENLQRILWEGEWEHGHNFVQLAEGNYLDVTWDPRLSGFGFRVLPESWTTQDSFVGVINIKRRWDGAPIDETKQDLINALPKVLQERRERFLEEFEKWINEIHKN